MIWGMSLVLLFLACGANEGACGHRYNWLQLVSFFPYSWRRIRSSHKAPGSDTVFGNGDIICLAGASLDRSSSHDISSALRSSPRVRDFSSAAADLARKMSINDPSDRTKRTKTIWSMNMRRTYRSYRSHNVASEAMGVVPEDLRDNSLLCLNTGRVQVFHCLQE